MIDRKGRAAASRYQSAEEVCRERSSAGQEAAIRFPRCVRLRRADRDRRVRGMDRHLNRGRFAAASFLAVALWPLLPGVAAAQAAPHFVSAAPSITIVDMPPDSTPALNVARRPHHALRMRSEMAQNALRSFGVD